MNLTIGIKQAAAKFITAAAAIAAAVALPQIFHLIGAVSGTGAAVGTALLPMHLPVLLAAYLAGPFVGAAAGLLSPVVSFALCGMPAAELLPFMVIELAVYGLTAGALSRTRLPVFASLVITQLAGRAARAGAVLVSLYTFGNDTLTLSSAWTFVTAGIFGILLQWLAVPVLFERMQRITKLYE